ncbi:hypothetical protein F4802DRAFT_14876 [Xylaria palmicola]|nr:hypothetical protein F4802DRAFT_14876 [Xylaria palmicola]
MDNGTLRRINPKDPEDPKLLILAIPAIGGISKDTWREYNEETYSRNKETSLYQDLWDQALVYLYDFPSSWREMGVATLATRLLDCFVESPLSTALESSPYVDLHLAAYSTGGLVLKKALLDASQSNQSRRQYFVSKCYSIAFFGVPHHGGSAIPGSNYKEPQPVDGVAPLHVCVPPYSKATNRDELHRQFLQGMKEKQNFRKIWTFTEGWRSLVEDAWLEIVPRESASLKFEGEDLQNEEVVQVRSYHMGLSYFGNDSDAYNGYIDGLHSFIFERGIQVHVLDLHNCQARDSEPIINGHLQNLIKSGSENVIPKKGGPTIWIHALGPPSNSALSCLFQLARSRVSKSANFLDEASWMLKWNVSHHQKTHTEPYSNRFSGRTGTGVLAPKGYRVAKNVSRGKRRRYHLPGNNGIYRHHTPRQNDLDTSGKDIYLPYLSYDKRECEVDVRSKTVKRVLPPTTPHDRRTLDQYGNPGSMNPIRRDEDQVVLKHSVWESSGKPVLSSSGTMAQTPRTWRSYFRRPRPPSPVLPMNGKLLMVHTLWCWADSETIITACPESASYKPGKADLYGVIKEKIALTRREFSTTDEFFDFIVTQAVSLLLETAPTDLDVFNIFRDYFSKYSDTITRHIRKFISDQGEDPQLTNSGHGNSKKQDDRSAELFHGYLEMLDVEDEIKILLKLFDQQIQTMKALSDTGSGGFSDAIQKVVKYKGQALDIENACRSGLETFKNLFDMKTTQASLDEAYYARSSSKTLMVFTIVTVVFVSLDSSLTNDPSFYLPVKEVMHPFLHFSIPNIPQR